MHCNKGLEIVRKVNCMRKILISLLGYTFVSQQMLAQTDSIADTRELKAVVVKATNGIKSRFRVDNAEIIGQGQLIRAACCNLGESFTANPSVDVSYSDAATGAKQIKLLGLSGTYVQMLTENVPNLRGAALPYSLGYVPGPWMQSIQVSKGASSVKNGYESTTGQINIEFLKPQGTDGVRANVYQDSELKTEVNLDGSVHLNERLSTATLLHFENRQMDHDGNGDGFMDMPKLRQYNLMHRWAYVSPRWISQLMLRGLHDERNGGQSRKHAAADSSEPLYTTSVKTNRYEAQWKNGFTLNADHNTSVALMLHGSWHDADNIFGRTEYDVTQKNGYAQLMFETDITEHHNLSVGASLNHDYYDERFNPLGALARAESTTSKETTPGYAWRALGPFEPLRRFLHAASSRKILSEQHCHAPHLGGQGLSLATCSGRERVALGKWQRDIRLARPKAGGSMEHGRFVGLQHTALRQKSGAERGVLLHRLRQSDDNELRRSEWTAHASLREPRRQEL